MEILVGPYLEMVRGDCTTSQTQCQRHLWIESAVVAESEAHRSGGFTLSIVPEGGLKGKIPQEKVAAAYHQEIHPVEFCGQAVIETHQ